MHLFFVAKNNIISDIVPTTSVVHQTRPLSYHQPPGQCIIVFFFIKQRAHAESAFCCVCLSIYQSVGCLLFFLSTSSSFYSKCCSPVGHSSRIRCNCVHSRFHRDITTAAATIVIDFSFVYVRAHKLTDVMYRRVYIVSSMYAIRFSMTMNVSS